jgi:hypothetical protein
MLRLVAIALFLVALACGGQESSQTMDDEAGAVGAAAEEAASAEAEGTGQAEAEHPSVQGCLDLVMAGKFAEAIPPCTEAARHAPGNEKVTEALNKAKTGAAEAAAEAAAAKAAEGAAAEASEAAAGGLEGATEGLADKLP